MDGELLIVILTSLCSGGIECFVEIFINSQKKKKEEQYRYKKEITVNYCKRLYEVYRIFHVTMEPMLKFDSGVDMDGLMEETANVYKAMLELDAYYVIYREVLDNEMLETEHNKLRKWLYDIIKPAMDSEDEQRIETVFCDLYNDLQIVIKDTAQILSRKVMKYCEKM